MTMLRRSMFDRLFGAVLGVLVVGLAAGVVWSDPVPFTYAPSLAVVEGGAFVIVLDLDRDGDEDQVVAELVGDRITVVENSSTTPQFEILGGFDQAISVAAGDLDRDGWPDVVAAQRGGDGSLYWLRNPSGELGDPWTASLIASDLDGARWVHVADLDGDGDLDVIGARFTSANPADTDLVLYVNADGVAGSWNRWNIHDEATFRGAHSAVTADIDHDGDLDVVAAAYTEDMVAWFENDGSIHSNTDWTLHPIDTDLDQALCVHVVDINQNGRPDVLAVGYGVPEVRLYKNLFSGFVEQVLPTPPDASELAGPYSVTAADLNMDRRVDVVAAARDGDRVMWWEQVSGSSFAAPQVFGTDVDGARSVTTADLDRDGDPDILVTGEGSCCLLWWKNVRLHPRSVFKFLGGHYTFAGATAVAAGDLFVDSLPLGNIGIVVAGYNSDDSPDLRVWDTNLAVHVDVTTTFDGAEDVALGDIDGDGRVDIVAASSRLDAVSWWRNLPSGWVEVPVTSAVSGAIAVDVGDLDGDGDLDLVVAGYLEDDLRVFKNIGGTGTSWTGTIRTVGSQPSDVRVGDVNGDGRLDVVYGTVGSDQVGWFKNTGASVASWTHHSLASSFHATGVEIADVNGDGRADVLAADPSSDRVYLWRNLGGTTPMFLTVPIASDFDGAWKVRADDIDRDGDTDIMAVGRASGCVTWWENPEEAGDMVRHDVTCSRIGVRDVLALRRVWDSSKGLLTVTDDPGDPGIVFFSDTGGQMRTSEQGIAPWYLDPGASAAILDIDLISHGHSDDSNAELQNLVLKWRLFTGGTPTAQWLNGMLSGLRVYHDSNRDEQFDAADDTLIASVFPIAVDDDGVTVLPLTHGSPNPSIRSGGREKLFVVVELQPDAATYSETPVRLRHLTYQDGVTLFRYTSIDGGLSLEGLSNTGDLIRVTPADMLFWDDFESGDTEAWSAVVGGE